jgi:hypothetical protein
MALSIFSGAFQNPGHFNKREIATFKRIAEEKGLLFKCL